MISVYLSRSITIYFVVLAAVFGAVMGSFLNCVAWRISHGESFLKGRSHCPRCGHVLGVLDLFPVFSWLFLRGRCRYCKAKVSLRYPLTELFFGLVTVLCLLRFDFTVVCLRNYIFLCCLFCLSLVDLEIFEIPNGLLVIPAAAFLLALPFTGLGWRQALWQVLAGLAFGGGLLLISLAMDKLLKKESLGGGDIKLYALVGLYLGFASTLFSLILACILGLLFAFLHRVTVRENGGQIPFGPSIAAAAAVMLLYGDGFVGWYMGLMGI